MLRRLFMELTLAAFIDQFRGSITREVTESYTPLYRPSEQTGPLPPLLRQPMGAQEDAVRAVVLALTGGPAATVVGEMGTGKTFIAAAAVRMAGLLPALVLCPPHMVEKWKAEIEMTVTGSRVVIVKSITDLEKVRRRRDLGSLWVVMSRERAKLSYRWGPAVLTRWARDEEGLHRPPPEMQPYQVLACPQCGTEPMDGRGNPLSLAALRQKRTWCRHCRGALWTANRSLRRYALSDYIRDRMKGFFKVLVGDEVHEFKGKGSAQGIAAGVLADVCDKSITLSGTIMGGYSSTLFHLPYRFAPEIRSEFGHGDERRWIKRYGFEEETIYRTRVVEGADEHGRTSRRRGYRNVVREKPGLLPTALFHLIGQSVFLRLSDVASGLPSYEEEVMQVSLDEVEDEATGYSQSKAYKELASELYDALTEALQAGSKRLLAAYLQSLLAYPDGCTRGETVLDHETGNIISQIPPLNAERVYPKEQALLDLVATEKAEGRRVLVYVTHTETRDITPRLSEMLGRAGIRSAVLKSHSVEPQARDGWIKDRVAEGLDVLICHPRLVQTGLDLIQFPVIVWYETDYSVYTTRQASRRSWRIGQTEPVKVLFMAYRGTLQGDAIKLVARKMQASLAVEGELPEEGLSAFGDDGEDVMMTLARRIVGDNESGDDEELETVFASFRVAEDESEEYLVDDDWRRKEEGILTEDAPDVQEEVLEIGPELVPAAAVDVMSLSGFLAEPDVPALKGRRRKKGADTASQSLFAWALEQAGV